MTTHQFIIIYLLFFFDLTDPSIIHVERCNAIFEKLVRRLNNKYKDDGPWRRDETVSFAADGDVIRRSTTGTQLSVTNRNKQV